MATDGWMDGSMDGWIDGWMDQWMDNVSLPQDAIDASEKDDLPTDFAFLTKALPTDRRTNGRTHPLIESWLTTKNILFSDRIILLYGNSFCGREIMKNDEEQRPSRSEYSRFGSRKPLEKIIRI